VNSAGEGEAVPSGRIAVGRSQTAKQRGGHMRELRYLKLTSFAAVFIWSALLGGFLYYDVTLARRHTEELAHNEARANYDTNEAFRLWLSDMAGSMCRRMKIRLPIRRWHIFRARHPDTIRQEAHVNELGLCVTQLMSQFGELYGIKGKLTSFKLLNLKNAPDAWEIEAMHRFESGREEVFEFTDIDGEPYLRLMVSCGLRKAVLNVTVFRTIKSAKYVVDSVYQFRCSPICRNWMRRFVISY